jgi:hypothetical protein
MALSARLERNGTMFAVLCCTFAARRCLTPPRGFRWGGGRGCAGIGAACRGHHKMLLGRTNQRGSWRQLNGLPTQVSRCFSFEIRGSCLYQGCWEGSARKKSYENEAGR